MNYDFKVFGKVMRGLRAVNVEIVLFCLPGLYNVLTPGFDFIQALVFIPFLVVFFIWKLYFRTNTIDFEELDWEQQFQYLGSRNSLTEREVLILKKLDAKFFRKYYSSSNFVEAHRFFFPLAVILISLIIYAILGFNEAGFEPSRFF